MKQILVKVRDISKDETGQKTELYGTESILTYNAYKHLSSKFELLYQCDEDGKMVVDQDGNPNPNLNAQHQAAAQQKSAVPVVKAGPVIEETIPDKRDPVVPETVVVATPPQRKKPGPKPKQELQEHVA